MEPTISWLGWVKVDAVLIGLGYVYMLRGGSDKFRRCGCRHFETTEPRRSCPTSRDWTWWPHILAHRNRRCKCKHSYSCYEISGIPMYVLPKSHEDQAHLVLEGEFFVNPNARSIKVRAVLNPDFVSVAYLPKDKRYHTGWASKASSSSGDADTEDMKKTA